MMETLAIEKQDTLAFERKIGLFSRITDFLRIGFLSSSVLIIIAVSGILFFPNTAFFNRFIQFTAWCGFFLFLAIGLGTYKSRFKQRTFKKNPQTLAAIEIQKGNKSVSNTPFWAIYLDQINKSANPKIDWQDLFEPFDKLIGMFTALSFILYALFSNQLTSILLMDANNINLPTNVSIIVSPPKYTAITPFNLQIGGKQKIPEDSEILVNVFGESKQPQIKFANQNLNQVENGGKFTSTFKIVKSGKLVVTLSTGRFLSKIFSLKDKAPKIKSFSGVISYKDNLVNIHIEASDDYSITRAFLVLEGKINGELVHETIDLETVPTKKMNGIIAIDTAKSALIGQRAKARLVILDDASNSAQTRVFTINILEPNFATPFARALNEIRLEILRETSPYKGEISQKLRIYDEERGQEVLVNTASPIDNAPIHIQSAYRFLQQLFLFPEAAGLDETKLSAINYALTVLEGANNLKDAKEIAPLLWDIIETQRNPPPSTQSLIAEKIQELKDAIQNGANEEEIDDIKRQLQSAISQHISELAQNQEQSGDMEIEDNSNIDDESISRALENINSNSDPNEASDQLDALNQMLQNLKVTQETDQSNGGQDYLSSQKEILDETLANPEAKHLSEKQEALARDLMQSNQGKDKNLENAKDAMLESAQSLRDGNGDQAIDAQRRAIEAILKSNQNPQSSGDPLGRQDNSQKQGKTQAEKESQKVLNKSEESKSRTIIQRLRELLGMPDKSEKEKQYYEDLMRME